MDINKSCGEVLRLLKDLLTKFLRYIKKFIVLKNRKIYTALSRELNNWRRDRYKLRSTDNVPKDPKTKTQQKILQDPQAPNLFMEQHHTKNFQ